MKINKLLSLNKFMSENIDMSGNCLYDYINENIENEFLYEGGNAFDNVRKINQEETVKIYDFVQKKIFPIIGLAGEGIDAAVIGSYGKKSPDQLSGDIDIAVSADIIAGVNKISLNNVLDTIDNLISKAGYSTKKMIGFNQVSVAVKIPNSDDYAQVDLMLSTNLEWSKFMYHSPDFTKAESKYKGLYRNMILMAIISEMSKKITKTTPDGDTAEYKQYVIRLGDGIFSVAKSFIGKKGNLVKTASLLHDQDKFITNTPESVVLMAFGEHVLPSDIMTFEAIWYQITSNDFIYKDKLKTILEKYKMYLVQSKVPFPTECVEMYPQIFQ